MFRDIHRDLPGTLAQLDAELERVLVGYLDAAGIRYEWGETNGRRTDTVSPSARLPEPLSAGLTVALGAAHALGEIESLPRSRSIGCVPTDLAMMWTGSAMYRRGVRLASYPRRPVLTLDCRFR